MSRLLLAPHAATVHARARRTSHHAMARRGAQARHLKRTRHPYPLPGSAWQPAVFKLHEPRRLPIRYLRLVVTSKS